MKLLILIYNFFKIGLFTIGGGLAILPLLQEVVTTHGWLTQDQFMNMIAVSQSTPGAIGINTTTFAGYSVYGVLGAVLASVVLVMPGMILSIILLKFIDTYKENRYVKYALTSIRAVVIGIILVAIVNIAKVVLIDIKSIILFGLMFVCIRKFNKHPVLYIAIGAITGMVIWM